MKTYCPTPRALALALLTLTASAWLAADLSAASAPPPNVTLDVKKVQKDQKEAAASSSSKKSSKSGGSSSGGSSRSVTYALNLKNNSAQALSGITVDYTVYTRTSKTDSKGNNSTSYKETSDTSSVDLPADGNQTVETTAVTTGTKQTKSKKGGASGGTSKVELAGIWVQVKYNDTVITTYEDPDDIKATMAEKEKSNPKDSGESSEASGDSGSASGSGDAGSADSGN